MAQKPLAGVVYGSARKIIASWNETKDKWDKVTEGEQQAWQKNTKTFVRKNDECIYALCGEVSNIIVVDFDDMDCFYKFEDIFKEELYESPYVETARGMHMSPQPTPSTRRSSRRAS